MPRKTLFLLLMFVNSVHAQAWQAKWISCQQNSTSPNSFFAYRKQATVSQVPSIAVARIAADTKYWLWINDKIVVRDGGLKRGPGPDGTYYDEVDIAPYLRQGSNIIAVQLCFLGREGFAHKNSGKAGLLFDCQSPTLNIFSDTSWRCSYLRAYQEAPPPISNQRLAESSILYDATKDIGNWQTDLSIPLDAAIETGAAGDQPWNALVKRAIPFWKDSGLKDYVSQSTSMEQGNTIFTGTLPYNAQVNPYFKINAANAGSRIMVCTDNYLYYDGSDVGLRFEYITRKGVQEFELPAWINGHKVYYHFPPGITLEEAKYRETGYNATIEGNFSSSDPFLNKLWEKAARTLYVCMRDNYMDCPDRERAQWLGDAVHQAQEAAYALAPSSYALTKKWLHELLSWQRPDATFWGPVPAGNFDLDYPDQTLAALGMYGLWSYYMNTGDLQMITDFYPQVIRYINNLYELDSDGIVTQRWGYPFWGDRTDNKDILLIANGLYFMTLKSVQHMAKVLDKKDDYDAYTARMKKFSDAFNKKFWNGTAYRHPGYNGKTDDRAQALAVIAGIAERAKFPAILEVLKKEEHASTYMEKYVTEALFIMGYGSYALERHKKRFAAMVNNEQFSTLWEDWNYGYSEEYGGSTVNHAWSGGGLILLSQYLCGIAPLEPAYKTFQIMPQPSSVRSASAKVSTVAGMIESSYDSRPGRFTLNTVVPAGTQCVVGVENGYDRITINGTVAWEKGNYTAFASTTAFTDGDSNHIKFKIQSGNWNIVASAAITKPSFQIDAAQFITVFPNPVNDYLYVSFKLTGGKPIQLSLTSLSGAKLLELGSVNDGDRIPMDRLPAGVYIITIATPDDKKYAARIIKL
jgi:alpha-L-rhamnosidase